MEQKVVLGTAILRRTVGTTRPNLDGIYIGDRKSEASHTKNFRNSNDSSGKECV